VQVEDSSVPQKTATKDLSITVNPYAGTDLIIIWGTVTYDESPLQGVVMDVDDGLINDPITNVLGNYFVIVPSSWSGTVTPVLNGYVFYPPSRTYNNVTHNQDRRNYTAYLDGVLTVSTTWLLNGTVNWPYSEKLEAVEGSGSYSWSLVSAPAFLPPGLDLYTNGEISGTPLTPGTYNFTVRVTDQQNFNTADKELSITINSDELLLQQMITYWKFNEEGTTAIDSSGNGVDGTLNENVIHTNDAVEGYAVETVGRGWIDAPWKDAFYFADEATLMAYVKIDDFNQERRFVWKLQYNHPIRDWPYTIEIHFDINENMLNLHSWNGLKEGGSDTDHYWVEVDLSDPASGFNLGQYNHIALTMKDNSCTIFINGNPVVSEQGAHFKVNDRIQCFWVMGAPWSDYWLEGKMDELAVYNRILSEQEIQQYCQDYQIIITTTALPEGEVATYYSTSLDAIGGSTPYTWGLAPGSNPLPNGLVLQEDGTINGTSTSEGTFDFTVQVTDDSSPPKSGTKSFIITINPYDGTELLISGVVTVDGSPLQGVVMDGLPGNPKTNDLGEYIITVSSSWSGTVTPTLAGYTFSLVSRAYENITEHQTNQDYTATPIPANLDNFIFDVIDNQATGVAFSITITAKDSNGDTVTTYTGANTLSDTTGTINPTFTSAFTNGTWTGDVTIKNAQTGVTITTSGGGKTGVSNAFNVTVADTTKPTVDTFSPADDATGVAIDANLVINFSEAVDVESGDIVIKKSADDITLEAIDVTSNKVTGTGTPTITINPTANFTGGTGYYVLIDATCFDDPSGNSYAGISDKTTWNFTTITVDTTPPTVTSFDPADDATGVGVNANLVITFSEDVEKGTTGNIVIYKSDDTIFETIAVTDAKVSIVDNVVTINPDGTLAGLTGYYVQIAATCFKDASGNFYAGIIDQTTWNFTALDVGNLVAYYPFNGNANDESGNGNNGTVEGATLTTDRFGNPDSAYSFDGVDDRTIVSDSNTLDITDAITITAWIKPVTVSGKYVVAKRDDSPPGGNVYDLDIFPGKVRALFHYDGGGSATKQAEGTTNINVNEWQHIAVTCDGTTITVYYNGQPDGTGSFDNEKIHISGGRLEIGMYSGGWVYFDGSIDEVRIYNRALSGSEVEALYLHLR